jgi:hypothetical protein
MTDDLKSKIIQALKENADPPPPEAPKLKKKNPYNKKPRLSPIMIILLACLILVVAVTLFSSDPDTITGPYGKIINPITGTTTGIEVNVTVETRNIKSGEYVWLVVDKPEINLCWPKNKINPNTAFKTAIYEEGKKERYTLSLYMVHKTINDQWQEWLDKEMFGGLPMLPDNKRLDSVQLILGG